MATWRGFDDQDAANFLPYEAPEDKTLSLRDLNYEMKSSIGTALLRQQATIRMSLAEANLEIPVLLTGRVIVGRCEFDNSDLVDVDLTPYGAREKGVSRRHAALYRTSHVLSVVDLGSHNGTYLNGLRLLPQQPRLLRSGDEVAFGAMLFHIHFEKLGQFASAG
jgi:hypothetical protein